MGGGTGVPGSKPPGNPRQMVETLIIPAKNAPKQPQDLVLKFLKFLDAQFPLLYIEPTQKRVLNNCRIVSG